MNYSKTKKIIFKQLLRNVLTSKKRLYSYGFIFFLFTFFCFQAPLYAGKTSFGLTLNSTVYADKVVSHYFDKQVPDVSFGTFFQYQLSNTMHVRAGLLMDFERFVDKMSYLYEDERKYLITHLEVPVSLMYSYYDICYIRAGFYIKKYLFSIKLNGDKSYNEQDGDFLHNPETGGLVGLEFLFHKWSLGLIFQIPIDRNSTEPDKNVDELKVQLNYTL
jgi:hypothetical protein